MDHILMIYSVNVYLYFISLVHLKVLSIDSLRQAYKFKKKAFSDHVHPFNIPCAIVEHIFSTETSMDSSYPYGIFVWWKFLNQISFFVIIVSCATSDWIIYVIITFILFFILIPKKMKSQIVLERYILYSTRPSLYLTTHHLTTLRVHDIGSKLWSLSSSSFQDHNHLLLDLLVELFSTILWIMVF